MAYLECSPGFHLPATGKSVLLLHGAAYRASTWRDELPTLQTLAALGHRAVAVDLPGHGNTAETIHAPARVGFLAAAVAVLFRAGPRPVVVSPSMSGSYSVPALLDDPGVMCGYVPVAPGAAADRPESDFDAVRVPTLIVQGEEDHRIGDKAAPYLVRIPTASAVQVINLLTLPDFAQK